MAEQEKEIIVITGACGRIGSALTKRLGEKYRIVGFELLHAMYSSANEELVPVDVSSEESVHQAFAHIRNFYGNKIKAVIHLAAYYSFSNPSYAPYKKITVEGTKHMLKQLQSFDCEQFIFSSTMLVHKPGVPGQKINEESPVVPKWAYPRSKVETEAAIHEMRGNMKSVILRIAGVYDDDCHSIPISNQIQRIYENQITSKLFPGDITHGSNFMHMDDLVDALCLCVEKSGDLPEETVLEMGEEKTLSFDFLQNRISQLCHGVDLKTYQIPKWFAMFGAWMQNHTPFMNKPFIQPWMVPLADDHYDLDISKAERVLGWKPKHNLNDTLPLMIEDLKRDPWSWYKKNGLKPSHKMMHQHEHQLENEVDAEEPPLSRVIVKAWRDPEYKKRLERNPQAALAEMGLEYTPGMKIDIPPSPANANELSDEELKKMAAAGGVPGRVIM